MAFVGAASGNRYLIASIMAGLFIAWAVTYSIITFSVVLVFPLLAYFIFRPRYLVHFLLLVRPSLELWTAHGVGEYYVPHQTLNTNAALSLFTLLVFFCSVIAPSVVERNWKKMFLQGPVMAVWLAFLGYFLVISLIFSPDRALSLLDWGRWLNMFAVYLIAAHHGPKDTKGIAGLLFCAVLSSVLPVIAGLVEYVQGEGYIAYGTFRRIRGFFINSVSFSQYLALVGIFLFCLLRSNQHRVLRLLLIGYSFPLLGCLALSYGKGGWLGLSSGMLVLAALEKAHSRKMIWVSAVITIAIAYLTFLPDTIPYVMRVANLTDAEQSSMATRILIWNELLPLFLSSPLFGHGLHAGYISSPLLLGFLIGPHSDYIRLLIDGGVIGLFLFASLTVLIMRSVSKAKSLLTQGDPKAEIIINSFFAIVISFLMMASVDNILSSLLLQYNIWIIGGAIIGTSYENSYRKHETLPRRGR
jgi:O-antigen ligase